MTAGTLSTLPHRLSRLYDKHGRPNHAAAGARAAPDGRLNPDGVFEVVTSPSTLPAAPEARPALDVGRLANAVLIDRMEYEARGLLNLVGFATRCLDGRGASGPQEVLRWRGELERANARLVTLYEAGLPRDFLTNPRKRERPAVGAIAHGR